MVVAGLAESSVTTMVHSVSAMSARTRYKEERMLGFRLVRILTLVTVTAAFGTSHAASASTFDGVGNHTLTSANLSFTSVGLGGGSICLLSIFEVNVASATSATVTNATFTGCNGTDGLAPFTAVPTVTGLPWRVTPVGDGVTIDGIHIVVHFPGSGITVTLTGNLAGGAVNNATHTVTYAGGTGLFASANGGAENAATVSGDFRDAQNTLAVTT
jgi:hypothetical protein